MKCSFLPHAYLGRPLLLLLPGMLLLLSYSVSGSTEVRLSDNRLLKVDLAEARLVGELRGYAIIAGRSCIDCDENTAIYFQRINGKAPALSKRVGQDPQPEPEQFLSSPEGDGAGAASEDRAQADTDGIVEIDLSGERFTYPGQYRDYLTSELVEKTRMFYGSCHEGVPSVLWLTEYLTEDGWEKEEFLIVFRDDGVEHRYVESRHPSLLYIGNEGCKEVAGETLVTEP